MAHPPSSPSNSPQATWPSPQAPWPSPQAPWHIGVDIGGTFTDVVLADDRGDLHSVKSPSVPGDPAEGLIAGLRMLAAHCGMTIEVLLGGCALFVHGSTVATNILLERKGARAGMLSTEGFRDSLENRRGYRPDPWDHRTPYPPVLVPRYLRLPVTERIDRLGREVTPLDMGSVDRALDVFEAEKVESVAICFLNSFLDSSHEQKVAARVRERLPNVTVSVSSDIVPLAGEYERTSTTAVDAYVAPRLTRYLGALQSKLASLGLKQPLLLVKNNGGTASVDEVLRKPVALTLSGPAAGIGALDYIGASLGTRDLISVEVGGTSCDVLLMSGGRVNVTDTLSIGDYDVLIPSVEVHTVGAGGGTIARVDGAGVLHVGPQGAGARPGPACYGFGGEDPTVTDAQLYLGRLHPGSYAGGTLTLDRARAERAIREKVAEPLGIGTEQAAAGILRIVEQRMLHAVSYISVQRGLDPRRFTLVSGGGAGALHIAEVARGLGCRRAYVPRVAGVFCALGMLNSDVRHDFVRSRLTQVEGTDPAGITRDFEALEASAKATLARERFADKDIDFERELDLRYRGQQWDVRVRLPAGAFLWSDVRREFEAEYARLFGHTQPGAPLEVVNLRLAAFGRLRKPALKARASSSAPAVPRETRKVWLVGENVWRDVPIYTGAALFAGHALQGPLVVEEETTTILLSATDKLVVDAAGNYLIDIGVIAGAVK